MARYEWQETRNGRRFVRLDGKPIKPIVPKPAVSKAAVFVNPPDPPVSVVESAQPDLGPVPITDAAIVVPKPKTTRRRRSKPNG